VYFSDSEIEMVNATESYFDFIYDIGCAGWTNNCNGIDFSNYFTVELKYKPDSESAKINAP
jgi:hypothetical protein